MQDACMQTLTHAGTTLIYIQIIGWRDNPARRLLVYMTDAGLHFGADGKVAGMALAVCNLYALLVVFV